MCPQQRMPQSSTLHTRTRTHRWLVKPLLLSGVYTDMIAFERAIAKCSGWLNWAIVRPSRLVVRWAARMHSTAPGQPARRLLQLRENSNLLRKWHACLAANAASGCSQC